MKPSKPNPARPKLQIHEVALLFPPMTPEEYADLKADIDLNGLIEPIWTYKGSIIDGRHRYRACCELDKPFTTREWDGKGSLDAFVFSLNLNKRSLETSQRAALSVRFMEREKIAAKKRMSEGGKHKGEAPVPPAEKGKSRDKAAEPFRVSGRYVSDAKFVYDHDKKLFQKLIDGDMKVSVAKRAVHRKIKDQNHKTATLKLPPMDLSDCKIIQGDCIEQLEFLPAKSVRLIFADPPYNIGVDYGKGEKADQRPDGEFVEWCRRWIAECARVLTPDGSIFVMMDRKYTNRIGIALADAGLHQRNIVVWTEDFGNHTSHNFTNCARFIHYYTRDTERFVFDGDAVRFDLATTRVPSERQTKYRDKRADPAGKVPSNVWPIPAWSITLPSACPASHAAADCPGRTNRSDLQRAGDLVVDPFNGSGTTALAAMRNGRKFTGFEINKNYVAAAKRRISLELAAIAGKGSK